MIDRRQALKVLGGTAIVGLSGCSQSGDDGDDSTASPEPTLDDISLPTPSDGSLDKREREGTLTYVATVSDDQQEGTAWAGLYWRDDTSDERASSPATAEQVEYSTESTTVELAAVADMPSEYNDATLSLWPHLAKVTITNEGPEGTLGITATDGEGTELASTTTEIGTESTITVDLEVGGSTPVEDVQVEIDPGVSQE